MQNKFWIYIEVRLSSSSPPICEKIGSHHKRYNSVLKQYVQIEMEAAQ